MTGRAKNGACSPRSSPCIPLAYTLLETLMADSRVESGVYRRPNFLHRCMQVMAHPVRCRAGSYSGPQAATAGSCQCSLCGTQPDILYTLAYRVDTLDQPQVQTAVITGTAAHRCQPPEMVMAYPWMPLRECCGMYTM